MLFCVVLFLHYKYTKNIAMLFFFKQLFYIELTLIKGMSGTAEIITENLAVFDRLLDPIKAVVKR